MNKWEMLSGKAMFYGLSMLVIVTFFAPVKAMAGTKTYLGMNYGIIDGCRSTSLVGGQQLNELIAIEGSAVIDSTPCAREGQRIEITSMIGVHLNLSIPTLNDSWYIEVAYGHTQLSRIGASSFGGSTFGFGAKYYIREAYSLKAMYSEIGDIGYFKLEGRVNF